MLTFNHTCIGHIHLQSGRPCQDASFAGTIGDLHLAIVSDGHGGKDYTRSDIGSQLAVECATAIFQEVFTSEDLYAPDYCDLRPETLKNLPFCIENHELFSDNHHLPKEVANGIRMIQNAIIYRWRDKVRAHAEQHPLSPAEVKIATVYDSLCGPSKDIYVERLYGCTLVIALVYKDFWLLMQIGDGRCVAFRTLPDQLVYEPLPVDHKCFLNKTTSLCDSNYLSIFHYCIGGQSTIPYAILLGTDGIENSWGTDDKLYNFYIDLLKKCDSSSPEELIEELQTALPLLSRVGSHDDMSIAGIVNTDILRQQVPALLSYQIEQRRAQLEEIETRRAELQQKIKHLQEYFDSIDIERLMRDLQNMQSDLEQRTKEQQHIKKKLDALLSSQSS